MKKKLALLLSVFITMALLGLQSHAASSYSDVIEPRWTNTGTCSFTFDFNNSSMGTAGVTVNGKFGVNKIVGEIIVYKQSSDNWVYVTSDTLTKYSKSFMMSMPITNVSGSYCKAEFVITVYLNDIPEVITHTCYATCP